MCIQWSLARLAAADAVVHCPFDRSHPALAVEQPPPDNSVEVLDTRVPIQSSTGGLDSRRALNVAAMSQSNSSPSRAPAGAPLNYSFSPPSRNHISNSPGQLQSQQHGPGPGTPGQPPAPPSQEAIQQLLYRASRDALSPELMSALHNWMTTSPSSDVSSSIAGYLDLLVAQAAAAKGPPGTITKARDLFTRMAGGNKTGPVADFPDVRLSHYVLPFGRVHISGDRIPPPGAAASRPPPAIITPPGMTAGAAGPAAAAAGQRSDLAPPPADGDTLEPCPLHTPLTCSLTLTNHGKARCIVSVRPLQSLVGGDACLVAVEPGSVSLKHRESVTVTVTLRFLRPDTSVDAFIVIEPAGGNRLLALARAVCERTVFGVRLEDVPSCSSGGYSHIPVPLAMLRARLLLTQREQGGSSSASMLTAEGIFRVAPSNKEQAAIRQSLNEGSFSPSHPQHVTGIGLAHMVKVFLRELPRPLLSAIPTETLLGAATEEDCISLIGWLTPPASIVFAWLVDLLVEVSRHEGVNKMGAKNLAICTGPNLFVTDEVANPMEALMTSQKAVHALYRVINARQMELTAASAPPPQQQDGEQKSSDGGAGLAAPRSIFAEHLGLQRSTSVGLSVEDGSAGAGAFRFSTPQATQGALAVPARGSIAALHVDGGSALPDTAALQQRPFAAAGRFDPAQIVAAASSAAAQEQASDADNPRARQNPSDHLQSSTALMRDLDAQVDVTAGVHSSEPGTSQIPVDQGKA